MERFLRSKKISSRLGGSEAALVITQNGRKISRADPLCPPKGAHCLRNITVAVTAFKMDLE